MLPLSGRMVQSRCSTRVQFRVWHLPAENLRSRRTMIRVSSASPHCPHRQYQPHSVSILPLCNARKCRTVELQHKVIGVDRADGVRKVLLVESNRHVIALGNAWNLCFIVGLFAVAHQRQVVFRDFQFHQVVLVVHDTAGLQRIPQGVTVQYAFRLELCWQ